MSAAEPVTFAVVGHNEAATLRRTLNQARAAAQPGDRVWFVDSASSDSSTTIASAAGVEIVSAPEGKGSAVQAALAHCRDGVLCFLDADIEDSEHNIAQRLRDAVQRDDFDLLIGEYQEPARRRVVTPALFRPLVAALFPAVAALGLANPLSGFRALRTGRGFGTIPAGYGVEAHLDVHVVETGGRIGRCPVGRYAGPLRGYANIPQIAGDVAAAVLDLAVDFDRLDAGARPAWDLWVGDVIDFVKTQPPVGADDSAFLDELARLAARPLPPARSTS